MKKKSSKKTPPRNELMELRFVEKMTRIQIAEYYNTTYAMVRKWIRELDVPRPQKLDKKFRLPSMTSSGELIGNVEDNYSTMEKAKLFFEGRLVERKNYGYYLDGKLCSVDVVLDVYYKEVSNGANR